MASITTYKHKILRLYTIMIPANLPLTTSPLTPNLKLTLKLYSWRISESNR